MNTVKDSLAITRPQRPWLRWLKRLSKVLLLALIAVAIRQVWHHHEATKKLRETLADLDRTEPGWRLEEIEATREQIPEVENSTGLIIAAAQNLPRSWPSDDLSEDAFRSRPPNEMLSGDEFLRLSVELSRVKTAADIASRLADMPRGRHRLRNSRSSAFPAFPVDQLKSRTIITLLVFDSLLWNQRGESKLAILDCRAALNAARSLSDEPNQLSQLIRRAGDEQACWAIERMLGQGEPPPEEMTVLQKLIETEDAFPAQLTAERGERALGHQVFEALERGELSRDDLTSRRMGWLERTASPLWDMDIREDHALFLSLMTRRINEVQRPMHEQAALDKEFLQLARALPTKAFISRSLLPALSEAGEKFRRHHANLRCTIVALAADRFRREKKEWPDSITQLSPHYLPSVPLDPFDGEPLRYRRVENGVVLYSVGPDGLDNGGNLDREHPTSPDGDLGIRLWDSAKRRQPPQAKPLTPNPR